MARAWLACLIALPLLAACGFEPLHKPAAKGDPAPAQSLAQIQIRPVEGRIGQQLHNMLRDRLNPSGQPVSPEYYLVIGLRRTTTDLGIREDETATRANLRLTATYNLVSAEDNEVLLNGSSFSVNSYNILDLEVSYATTVAEEDAIRRGLREISDNIQLRLSTYFAEAERAETS
ncbi:MAG: LPS assembly lipoprotein LptE [Pseudomonadota bacterium]